MNHDSRDRAPFQVLCCLNGLLTLCANVFTALGARFRRSLDGHNFAALGYSKMLVDPRVTVTYTKAEYVALSNARFDVSSYSLRRTDLFANKAQETRCSLRLNRATKPRDRSYFTTSCSRPKSTRTTRVRTLSRHFSSSREHHVSRVESSRVRALIARSLSKRDAPGNLHTAHTGTRHNRVRAICVFHSRSCRTGRVRSRWLRRASRDSRRGRKEWDVEVKHKV